ncbi:single-stranded DNA-binding protein [Piscinibacterium candidicorallinum]|jgi:single-strand DNA-binding protein|uniref:Single-stranded DNA-binding protein n=1 Tax=Piscinibacterium candidicorallinum TaxID=1793872 RepID=A0ABV7H7S5_9BURK
MASVNKVIIVGNLGRDPEVRYTPDGSAITKVSLATTSKYKNKAGEMVEETEWHRVTFFGRLAEIAGEYLKKGRSVYVEGRLKTSKYTDKDGVEKYSTDIIANEMQMLGSREGMGAPSGGDDGFSSAPAPAARPAASRPAASKQPANFADMDDDIPF